MTTRRAHPLVLAATALLLVGCSSGGGDRTGSAASTTTPTASSTPSGRPGQLPTGDDHVALDPADFTPGSTHRYFPLEPGTRWTYREQEPGSPSLRVVVTVTGQTEELANGVTARVVRDTVTEAGEVVEDTFDWYAQDADGAVWYLGERTAEFEDGAVATRRGSFEAGADQALPGVIMPAEPEPGQTYRQEYREGRAEDTGTVLATGQQAQAAAGHWEDALLTADTTPLQPEVLEYKLYAPGVGLVLTLDASGGSAREELVRTGQVSDAVARRAGTAPLGTPYR